MIYFVKENLFLNETKAKFKTRETFLTRKSSIIKINRTEVEVEREKRVVHASSHFEYFLGNFRNLKNKKKLTPLSFLYDLKIFHFYLY